MKKSGDDQAYQERAKAYLAGGGTDAEREDWERLLLEDADMFSSYMEAMVELQDELPPLENGELFVQKVMDNWPGLVDHTPAYEEMTAKEEGQRRSRWYEKTIFHYVVAASLTLLFLSSGVFDRLLTGEMEIFVKKQDQTPSYSEQMMQATSGWLEQLMDGRHK